MEDFRSPRLLLRRWRDSDREPFARLNADPEVMAHFPGVLDRAASDALADRIEAHFAKHGFGLWAVEVQGGEPFIGFVGLARDDFDHPKLAEGHPLRRHVLYRLSAGGRA